MFTAIYGANKATNLTTNLTKKKKAKVVYCIAITLNASSYG